jgi:hypothetical protein
MTFHLYAYGIAAFVAAIVAHGLWAHGESRGRWGEERIGRALVGAGAYRAAPVFETRARHAPSRVLWAGILARVWATLTALVFAPAGGLAAFMFLVTARHQPLATLFMLVSGALAVSGLGLSFALVRAAHEVQHREHAEPFENTLRWSHAHHMLVACFFIAAALAFGEHDAWIAIALVVPPCLVGIGITLLLGNAGRLAAMPDVSVPS